MSSTVCHDNFIGAEDIIADIDVVNGQFTYKGIPINIQWKDVGRGLYGAVKRASFVFDGNVFYFAVKYDVSGIKLAEASFIEEHTSSVSCPGVISMKVRDYQGRTMAIMPLADGDLEKYVGKCTHEQADQIISVIRQALLCFHANGDYYYDLKPNNILVNCHGGVATFFLGDMGSLISLPDYDHVYIATYPPPDYLSGYVDNITDALKHYSYMLSCLYCYLISGAVPPYFDLSTGEAIYVLEKLVDATREKLHEGQGQGGVSADATTGHVQKLAMIANLMRTNVSAYLRYVRPIDSDNWAEP